MPAGRVALGVMSGGRWVRREAQAIDWLELSSLFRYSVVSVFCRVRAVL